MLDGPAQAEEFLQHLTTQMIQLGGHYSSLFIFMYDPQLAALRETDSLLAERYTQAELEVQMMAVDCFDDSPMGPRTLYILQREDDSGSLLLALLNAIRVTAEAGVERFREVVTERNETDADSEVDMTVSQSVRTRTS
jgi:hypothetical protein